MILLAEEITDPAKDLAATRSRPSAAWTSQCAGTPSAGSASPSRRTLDFKGLDFSATADGVAPVLRSSSADHGWNASAMAWDVLAKVEPTRASHPRRWPGRLEL